MAGLGQVGFESVDVDGFVGEVDEVEIEDLRMKSATGLRPGEMKGGLYLMSFLYKLWNDMSSGFARASCEYDAFSSACHCELLYLIDFGCVRHCFLRAYTI